MQSNLQSNFSHKSCCWKTLFYYPGLIRVESSHDVKNTADRLETVLKENGMTVFLRVDHSEAARRVGEKYKPSALRVAGDPEYYYGKR